MSFGLKQSDLREIVSVIDSFLEIEQAKIYGSRAMGNYKQASDIDIAIQGAKITHKLEFRLHQILEEETILPYFFDITHYEAITSVALRRHIDDYGIVFFERNLS